MIGNAQQHGESVVSDKTTSTLLILWGGGPLVGAVAGWLLKLLAAWVVTLPWAPFQGPAELIESLPEPQVTIGAFAVGAIAGLAFAAYAVRDLLTVVVTNDAVTLTRHETTRTIERSAVNVVFMSGKTLIVLGHNSDQLVHENTDLNALALERAFTAHGFPWSPGDPHKNEYRS